MQKPEIVITCKDHGEVARMPGGWSPSRIAHEIASLAPCCKDGTIALVNVTEAIAQLASVEKDLVAARAEASQLRSEIELVRASASRQESELLKARGDLHAETEGARQVLIAALEPHKPVYTNQSLSEVAGLAQRLILALVKDQKNAAEQLTYIRRVLREALEPFEGINLDADTTMLAAFAQQRINLLVKDLARLAGNARVAEAALEELEAPQTSWCPSADRRYDVADAFKLDLYEGNAVVRLLNKDCPPAERIRHVERAAFYVDRLLRRLKSQHSAG